MPCFGVSVAVSLTVIETANIGGSKRRRPSVLPGVVGFRGSGGASGDEGEGVVDTGHQPNCVDRRITVTQSMVLSA